MVLCFFPLAFFLASQNTSAKEKEEGLGGKTLMEDAHTKSVFLVVEPLRSGYPLPYTKVVHIFFVNFFL